MITKEQTKDFIARAYDIAVKHGFHEKKLTVEHMMMLVLSEIGEAVEADRLTYTPTCTVLKFARA